MYIYTVGLGIMKLVSIAMPKRISLSEETVHRGALSSNFLAFSGGFINSVYFNCIILVLRIKA